MRQYDISDREHPKLTSKVQIGGVIASDPEMKLIEDRESEVSNTFFQLSLSSGQSFSNYSTVDFLSIWTQLNISTYFTW